MMKTREQGRTVSCRGGVRVVAMACAALAALLAFLAAPIAARGDVGVPPAAAAEPVSGQPTSADDGGGSEQAAGGQADADGDAGPTIEAQLELCGEDGLVLGEGAVVSGLTASVTVRGAWEGEAPAVVCVLDERGALAKELACAWESCEDGACAAPAVGAGTVADGRYRIAVLERCGEGEVAVAESPSFTLDTRSPELLGLRSVEPTIHEGVAYARTPLALSVRVVDEHFDPQRSTVDGHRVAWEREEDGRGAYVTSLGFGEGVGTAPVVRAVDLAGNESSLPLLGEGVSAVVVDLVAPVVVEARVDEPHVMLDDGAWWFFDRLATLSVSFVDAWPIASATLLDPAGLYEGTVTYGEGRRSGVLKVTLADGAEVGVGADFGRDVLLVLTDVAGNRRAWSIGRTGEVADIAGSDDANVSLNGLGIHPQALVADVTAPVVSISGVEAGAYYAAPPVVHVRVVERNFAHLLRLGTGQPVLRVSRRAGDVGGATDAWDVPVGDFSAADGAYAYACPLVADGHYELSAGLTDLSGNTAEGASVASFTVDTTAPLVEVSFDDGDRDRRFFSHGRVASVSVEEHNFDASLVRVDTNGVVGQWLHEGDMHVLRVAFSSDGSYRLAVHVTDRAGNEAVPCEIGEFVVDRTAPTVTISGVVDQGAYADVVEPWISWADEATFDAGAVGYSVSDAYGTDVTDRFACELLRGADGAVARFLDFPREPGVDGVYTIAASVRDRAGNSSETSVRFSVNRFGSSFSVEGTGGADGYETAVTLEQAPEVVVHELNVSGDAGAGMHTVLVTGPSGASRELARVGDARHATGFSGYLLEESFGSGGWHEYVYRIGSGNFADEGRYLVDVISVDAADNHNTTSLYYDRSLGGASSAEVEFVLDTVGPALELVSPGLELADEYVGSFRVVDDIQSGIAPDAVEVLLDGRGLAPSELTGPDVAGVYQFRVAALPFCARSLEVRVRDHAGRVARAAATGFVVTPPWSIACVAAGAVMLSALPLVVLRTHAPPSFLRSRWRSRRRRNRSDECPTGGTPRVP